MSRYTPSYDTPDLPDQSGNSGKYLTTDGSNAAWATLSGGGDMAAATYDPATKSEQVLTIGDILDEDNMATDSATKVPSQQSVKAYVDNNAGSVSDTAYGVGWDASTGTAPSQNAVYDKIETLQVKPSEGAFADGDKTKLDGIATGAEVNVIESLVEDTTPQLGGTLDANSNDIINVELVEFEVEVDNGNSSTADTIDWGAGNMQKSTMTDNCTYTFTAPSGPARVQLKLIQDATGSRTATWPASVKWPGGTAPTLTTAANSIDIITFWYDGTNYFGVSALDFQ